MKTTTTPSPSREKNKRVKANLFVNDNPEELVGIQLQQADVDTKKRVLRIDARTEVLVDPKLCTPQYAEVLRRKYEKARKNLYK